MTLYCWLGLKAKRQTLVWRGKMICRNDATTFTAAAIRLFQFYAVVLHRHCPKTLDIALEKLGQFHKLTCFALLLVHNHW